MDEAKRRKKLTVRVISTAEGGAGVHEDNEEKSAEKPQLIDDITAFKSSHEMYPLVQPYITITRKGNKCKL